MRRVACYFIPFVFLLLILPAQACLWDRDTLQQERMRFPSTLELITGHFLRHSPDFYRWRIKDRSKKIAEGSNDPGLYDDLAVAHDKLGQHDQAIKVILQKEKLSPGLYETAANLGTFYIHAGRFEEGLEEIDRALEINPDAHFGREFYQKLLVEYLLSRQVDGQLQLPLDDSPRNSFEPFGFARFVLQAHNIAPQDSDAISEEVAKALKGVLGMMRFGKHDSPVLLEAAADLILAAGYPNDGKRLAVRALLKASYETKTESRKYRQLAESAIFSQTSSPSKTTQLKLEALEKTFRKELEQASAWFQDLELKERKWIQRGADPEAEFNNQYTAPPQAGLLPKIDQRSRSWTWTLAFLATLAVIASWWIKSRAR
ncbi:MAG: hypothetical protein P1U77_21695 [Rubripirellula sp.]|nr:hypothetical protein [Rubripirellula sp.]